MGRMGASSSSRSQRFWFVVVVAAVVVTDVTITAGGVAGETLDLPFAVFYELYLQGHGV